jgi:hypothetical protein
MTDQPEQNALPAEPDAEATLPAQPEPYDPSLAELLGHLLRTPRRTLERVRAVLYELPEDRLAFADRAPSAAASAEMLEDNAARSLRFEALFTPTLPITRAQAFLAGGLALLTVLAFIGSADLQSVAARRSLELPFGGALLLLVMVVAALIAATNNVGLPLQRLAPLQLPATPSPAVAYQTPIDRFWRRTACGSSWPSSAC